MEASYFRLGCLVLAAGLSLRFQRNKLLEEIGGMPMLGHTLAALRQLKELLAAEQIGLEPIVVTRWEAVAKYCDRNGFACYTYRGGLQSDTLREGLAHAEGRNWKGCMFVTGDQPLMTAASMKRLALAFAEDPSGIVRMSDGKRPGNPVIFPESCFPELMRLKGDAGGRELIRRKHLPVRMVPAISPEELTDVDTQADLAYVAGVSEKHHRIT